VILVVNATRADAPSVHAQNRRTVALANEWIAAHRGDRLREDRLRFYALDFPRLPPRHAGVGLARRLGMDEAVARFSAVHNPDGVITCLDTDCCCDPNYLTVITAHFRAHPESPGCSIYFEHPLNLQTPNPVFDPKTPALQEPGNPLPGKDQTSPSPPPVGFPPEQRAAMRAAIVGYELYLRYYVHGLRYAGSPYAFYTVGSCMAVPTRIYEKQGGMNRRKAGEDFYFLQKLIGLGGFTDLRDTRVLPSSRISERTPFGTGRAIQDSLDRDDAFYTYAPEVFRDLRELLRRFQGLYRAADPHLAAEDTVIDFIVAGLPEYVSAFLRAQGFGKRYTEIRRNTASPSTFDKRLHRWFNALLTLQFIHFATAHRYPKIPIEQAARILLQWSEPKPRPKSAPESAPESAPSDAEDYPRQREALLLRYRAIDRGKNR